MDAVAVGVLFAPDAVTASLFLEVARMVEAGLEQEIESRIAALGFELVELEKAGSKARPILRLRVDRPGSAAGITLDDCAQVSRELESLLDGHPNLSERYVLEVSSPGLERPLVKRSDYERFAGKEVSIKTSSAVADLGKRIEGILRGIDDHDVVALDVGGRSVEVERSNIKKAHLVYKWQDKSIPHSSGEPTERVKGKRNG
jgi:ribosome maturation factor RimP